MKRLHSILFLAFFVLLFCGPASGLQVPSLNKRVNDSANMLRPATTQQLETMLATLETEDSTQVAVLTVTSLQGELLEDYSLAVAEQWKLGSKGRDNGALLLVAKSERKIRIEVGYDLEGVLTDLIAGRIIRDVIVPEFRKGNFDGGVYNGVSAIIDVVKGEFSAENYKSSKGSSRKELADLGIVGLFAMFFIGRIFSRNRIVAATGGAIIAPVCWLFFVGFQPVVMVLLLPAGFLAGYLLSFLFSQSDRSLSGRGRHHHYGGFGGGFGGGGGGSFGGFGGGGGGFGGGGASGGW